MFRFNFPYSEKVKSLATDNRLDIKLGSGGAEHEILAGVDYRNVSNLAQFGFGPGPVHRPFQSGVQLPHRFVTPPDVVRHPITFNDQRLKQTGAYVQDHIGVGKLFFTVGARQDWVKIRNRTSDDTTKQDKLTWRAGANYVFDNGFAPYIGYATSFEPVLGVDTRHRRGLQAQLRQADRGRHQVRRARARRRCEAVRLARRIQIVQKNVVGSVSSSTPVGGTQSGEVEVKGARVRDRHAPVAAALDQCFVQLRAQRGHRERRLPGGGRRAADDHTKEQGLVLRGLHVEAGPTGRTRVRRRHAVTQASLRAVLLARSILWCTSATTRRCSTRSSITTRRRGASRSTARTSSTSATWRAAPRPVIATSARAVRSSPRSPASSEVSRPPASSATTLAPGLGKLSQARALSGCNVITYQALIALY